MRWEVGHVYNRRADLHGRFGGQQQGGISTPADHPLIFLFTSKSGSRYGYEDEFRSDGSFWYTGEGQVEDMSMARGNRAIRDHEADGKELHLFEAVGGGNVRYIGQAFYLTHHIEERRDANDDLRQAIVLELAVETEEGEQETDEVSESNVGYDSCTSFAGRSMDELRRIALQSASPTASAEERRSNVYCRAKAVKEYVLRRADGTCEGCGKDAPFVTSQGRPYLESHHVRRVSDGGPDHPKWVIALCPNCHRRVHHGRNGGEYNARLAEHLEKIEAQNA